MARAKKTAAVTTTVTSTAPKTRGIDLQEVEARVTALDKAKRRSYDIFDIEQRVYNLEKNGSTPGPTPTVEPIVHWDFTSETTPLVDKVAGYTAILNGTPAINGDGVHIAADDQSITLPKALLMLDATYEIKFGASDLKQTGTNSRLFVTRPIDYSGQSDNATCGFCYVYGNYNIWGVYDTATGWQLSEESNKDIFNNGTLKIYVDILGKWHIYVNGELMYVTPVAPLIQQTIFSIGSGTSSCEDIYVEDIKIYRGEH